MTNKPQRKKYVIISEINHGPYLSYYATRSEALKWYKRMNPPKPLYKLIRGVPVHD